MFGDHPPGVADALHQVAGDEDALLGVGEVAPLTGSREERDRGSDRDVEAVDEPPHGDGVASVAGRAGFLGGATVLVPEYDRDLPQRGEVFGTPLTLHARVQHGVVVGLERCHALVAPPMAKHVEPLVRAFRYPAGREEAVRAGDDVDSLHPEGIAAPEHRRSVVWVVDVFENDGDAMGAPGHDRLDAFEAPVCHQRTQRLDDELGGVFELRRAGVLYLEDVGVVASHGRTMPSLHGLASTRPVGQTRAMESLEQRSRQVAVTVVPAAGVLYVALAPFEVLWPSMRHSMALAACCAVTGVAFLVLAWLLRSNRIEPGVVAAGVSVAAVFCGLAFVFFGVAAHTVTLVITLLTLGAFLFRPRVMVAAAGLALAGWTAIVFYRGFEPADLRVWAVALVGSSVLGVGITLARHRLVRSIESQMRAAERERARAEEVARQLALRTEELEQTRDRALASVEAKQRFLAHMSHEIRTPLNGILGLLELLARSQLDAVQRERLQQVQRSGDTLLAIVNDLLDLSRIEAGALALESVAFDVGRVLEEVTNNHAAAAHAKGVELLVQLDPLLPSRVFGDPLRLRQILTNLLSNAIKFTKEGEIVVRCHTEETTDADAQLVFGVTDTGIGMTAEELARVFAPFAQADQSTTREFGGTGLGLAITRQLVELMGGELSVESVKGEGTLFSFTICFPLADSLSGEGLQLSAALMDARVLLVDANPRVRGSLGGHLESWGVIVDVAEDLDVADRKLREAASDGSPYTVALVDLRTLGDDWPEATSAMAGSAAYGRPRVVVMSAGLVDPSEDRRKDGVLEALSKPIMRRQLLTTVARAHKARPLRPGRATSHRVERRKPTGIRAAVPTSIRVLVVEDQPTNRVVTQGFLDELGYVPVMATHGEAAVRMVREDEGFGLVLMDCQMPVMDGYEATRQIRTLEKELGRPRLPIVALTAHAFPSERARTMAAGMDGHLAKPLSIEALREVLMRWCPPGSVLDPEVTGELASLGGKRFFRRLRTVFATSVQDRMQAMADAAARSDLDQVRHDAHALKGAARQIGAQRLGSWLADLEDKPSQFGQWRPILEAELARVEAALSELLGD